MSSLCTAGIGGNYFYLARQIMYIDMARDLTELNRIRKNR